MSMQTYKQLIQQDLISMGYVLIMGRPGDSDPLESFLFNDSERLYENRFFWNEGLVLTCVEHAVSEILRDHHDLGLGEPFADWREKLFQRDPNAWLKGVDLILQVECPHADPIIRKEFLNVGMADGSGEFFLDIAIEPCIYLDAAA